MGISNKHSNPKLQHNAATCTMHSLHKSKMSTRHSSSDQAWSQKTNTYRNHAGFLPCSINKYNLLQKNSWRINTTLKLTMQLNKNKKFNHTTAFSFWSQQGQIWEYHYIHKLKVTTKKEKRTEVYNTTVGCSLSRISDWKFGKIRRKISQPHMECMYVQEEETKIQWVWSSW